MSPTQGDNGFGMADGTFDEARLLTTLDYVTIFSGTTTNFSEMTAGGPWTGTDFAFYRNYPTFAVHMSKIIFLGDSLVVTWATPTTMSPVSLGDSEDYLISDS